MNMNSLGTLTLCLCLLMGVIDVPSLNAADLMPAGSIAKDQTGDAPEAPRGIRALLKRLDKNNDGKISRNEWQDPDRLLLSRFDKNKDGKVTKIERRIGLDQNRDGRLSLEEKRTRAAHALRRLDRDNDGLIARTEYPRRYERFNYLDVNGDGVISALDALH